MSPTLPREITDHIIDFLWDDQDSLYNCALTCRAWLARSRYHLFSVMLIRDRHGLDCVVREFKNPHIRPLFGFVKHFLLNEGLNKPWVHLVPFYLRSLLPQIHELCIRDINWAIVRPHPSVLLVGFPLFTTVDTLKLRNCRFYSFRDLQRLLVSLPSLRVLSLDYVSWENGPLGDTSPESLTRGLDSSRPQLCALSLPYASEDDAVLFNWLSRARSITSMECLEITDKTSYEVSGRLVKALGCSLQHLRLGLNKDDTLAYVDLSNSSCLHTLTITFDHKLRLVDLLLPALLSRISNDSHLRSITFELCLFVDSDWPQSWTFWRRITEILMRDHFCDLQMVAITILYRTTFRGDASALQEEIRTSVSELYRRGVDVQLQHLIWDQSSRTYMVWDHTTAGTTCTEL